MEKENENEKKRKMESREELWEILPPGERKTQYEEHVLIIVKPEKEDDYIIKIPARFLTSEDAKKLREKVGFFLYGRTGEKKSIFADRTRSVLSVLHRLFEVELIESVGKKMFEEKERNKDGSVYFRVFTDMHVPPENESVCGCAAVGCLQHFDVVIGPVPLEEGEVATDVLVYHEA